MNSLKEPALAFIRGSGWTEPLEAARELVNLARCGCEWPNATIDEWLSTFEQLITDGRIQRRADGRIFLAVDVEPVPVQMGLF